MKSLIATLILISSCIYTVISNAESLTPVENKLLVNLVTHATEAKSTADFFQYGTACYERRLPRLIYYTSNITLSFWSNDTEGNCNLVALNLTTANAKLAYFCRITQEQYSIIFTDSALMALKEYDHTKTMNTGTQQTINQVNTCLGKGNIPTSQALNILTMSQQMQPPSSQQ